MKRIISRMQWSSMIPRTANRNASFCRNRIHREFSCVLFSLLVSIFYVRSLSVICVCVEYLCCCISCHWIASVWRTRRKIISEPASKSWNTYISISTEGTEMSAIRCIYRNHSIVPNVRVQFYFPFQMECSALFFVCAEMWPFFIAQSAYWACLRAWFNTV